MPTTTPIAEKDKDGPIPEVSASERRAIDRYLGFMQRKFARVAKEHLELLKTDRSDRATGQYHHFKKLHQNISWLKRINMMRRTNG